MDVNSFLSPKCEIRKSPIHGNGIFTREDIAAGEIVVIFGGDIIPADEEGLSQEVEDNLIQVFDTLYLGPRQPSSYGVNHSCDSNIGVKGQSLFVTRRLIQVGEELVFDYETTDTAYPGWRMQCRCGSPNCRGVIDGNSWKDPAFQQKHKGYFSWYLQEKIFKCFK